MNGFKTSLFIFSILFWGISPIFSQEKFEKEYRIESHEVPKKAFQLIEKWNFNTKIKWYAEESNDGKSFEAKLTYKGNKYSIEFDEKGTILDVEKTVKYSKLPKNNKESIESSLSKSFQKFKIKKIQIQFLGDENELFQAIFHQKSQTDKTNYETVIKGKKTDKYLMYEILLDADFNIQKELPFSSINSFNLEF